MHILTYFTRLIPVLRINDDKNKDLYKCLVKGYSKLLFNEIIVSGGKSIYLGHQIPVISIVIQVNHTRFKLLLMFSLELANYLSDFGF